MKKTPRNWVIGISLTLLWLPFLFVTDFYPFLRFGMFAEPIYPSTPQEIFVLYIQQNDTLKKYDTNLWGLDEGVFNYLARKYYYQKRLDILGEKLVKAHQAMYPPSQQKWYLYRLVQQRNESHRELVATYETQP